MVAAICNNIWDCIQLFTPLFRFILQIFYDCEVLTPEALTQWIAARRNAETPERALFDLPAVQQFVEWLEDEDDSDEEDSDEEESESD